METRVLKFGGASLATPAHFDAVASLIVDRQRTTPHIAVVVSAMGETTDDLLRLAHSVNPSPPQREVDMLVSVGERISMALLAMAIAKHGCRAISFTGSQSGIITSQHHQEAKIVEVRPHRLTTALQSGTIAIVAGFQGVSRDGEITTLGRGGSDTTAVALACALGACCVEFYKDVAGIFSTDPKEDPHAIHIPQLTHDEAIALTATSPVLHQRSVLLAKRNAIPLHVRSYRPHDTQTTIISSPHPSPSTPIYEDLCA